MTHPHRPAPFLWFDQQAEEAAETYASLFEDARVGDILRYSEANAELGGQSAGAVMTVDLQLAGVEFTALNGGPAFSFTPAISFFVTAADAQATTALFGRLEDGGTVLMPLQEYPFNECYGWVQDRFGVSWQIMTESGPQKIAPCLMFVGEQAGRAEVAMQRYSSIFPQSGIEEIFRYGADAAPEGAGSVMHAIFTLAGQEFRAMDSAQPHAFTFSEAISLQVHCDNQAEIDHYWQALSEGGDPAAQQCGWLKDAYGVSWQVVPRRLPELLRDPDPQKVERVTQAFLQMKKFDIAALERAHQGDAS